MDSDMNHDIYVKLKNIFRHKGRTESGVSAIEKECADAFNLNSSICRENICEKMILIA
jgi:hypothetical protein